MAVADASFGQIFTQPLEIPGDEYGVEGDAAHAADGGILYGQGKGHGSGTLCSMAAALPYAIGAQSAFPDRQVIAFTGDGSFSMMMGDFVTLAQHRLPVKVVVLKNNPWA